MITRDARYRRAFEDARYAFCLGMVRQRSRKKVTLSDLSEATYLGRDRIRNILKGKNGGTSMSVILDMAAFFGCSPAVFFPRGKE